MMSSAPLRWLAWAALIACSLGFKPNTHMHSSNVVRDGAAELVVGSRSYPLAGDVFDAIRANPRCYRAGVVGPDGFPDILFGQGRVHPEDGGFTYAWLDHVFERGKDGSPCVKAFTYGYLTHAAGDLWAHTLVNHFARGVFPGVADIAADPAAASIALRHLIVEGYIARFTPEATATSLDAPNAFVRDTFIRDRPRDFDTDTFCDAHPAVPTALAQGTHFDDFLGLRKHLCQFRAGLDPDYNALCLLDPLQICNTAEIIEALAFTYTTHWISDIDRGLDEWPQMAEDIAQALFDPVDPDTATDVAKARATEFLNLTLLSMLGAPDAVGEVNWAVGNALAAVGDVIAANPLSVLLGELQDEFVNWIFLQNFGISYDDLKASLTSPACRIDGPPLFGAGTSTQLDVLLTGADVAYPTSPPGCNAAPPVDYSTTGFATFANATTLARMVLMEPATLDEMLFDLNVGKLYTGTRLITAVGAALAGQMQKNAMLGFARSIDANHGWQRNAVDNAAGSGTFPVGEGMPIWRDCLARERAFPALFADSAGLGFSSFEGCGVLSDPLPPVSVILEDPRPLYRSCCFSKDVQVINQQRITQGYSFYFRVKSGQGIVFHRVVHRHGAEALAPRASRLERVGLGTCKPGLYTVEIFVFAHMTALPAEASANLEIPTSLDYWTIPVEVVSFQVEVPPQAECNPASCGAGASPIGSAGAGSSPLVPLVPGVPGVPGAPPVTITPVAGCCCPASDIDPPLDADDDKVPDATDLCPLIPNATGQACSPTAGIARVFEPWRGRDVIDLAEIAKLERAVRDGLLDAGSGRDPCGACPMCWTCPLAHQGMTELIVDRIKRWQRGNVSDPEIAARIEHLVKMVPQPFGVDVTRATVDVRTNRLAYAIAAARGGRFAIALPTAFGVDRRSRVEVAIDGRPVTATVLRHDGGIDVAFDVPGGAKEIAIGVRR